MKTSSLQAEIDQMEFKLNQLVEENESKSEVQASQMSKMLKQLIASGFKSQLSSSKFDKLIKKYEDEISYLLDLLSAQKQFVDLIVTPEDKALLEVVNQIWEKYDTDNSGELDMPEAAKFMLEMLGKDFDQDAFEEIFA